MNEFGPQTSTTYQYLATIIVNIFALNFGCSCGWTSPSLLLFLSENSPLPTGQITTEESSMIASLTCAGAIIGTLLFAYVTERFGRRMPLLLCAIPQIINWLLILYAQNIYYLYAARILAGICGGAAFVIIPLYVAEISDDKIRGTLGSLIMFANNAGILVAYAIGNYIEYETAPKIYIVLCIVFASCFAFFPETPQFLLKQNNVEAAENSLIFYRNYGKPSKGSEYLKKEIHKLRSVSSTDENRLTFTDFTTPFAKKALVIGVSLVALNQFCGCFTMLSYTAKIFEESGSNLAPNTSAIIVAVIQLCGTYISTILVDRSGRKLLLSVSAVGIGLGLTCLGSYILFKTQGYNLDSLSWIPIACFSFIIFIGAVGVLTLPFLVIAEIMPEKIRGFGASASMTCFWTFAFILVMCFPMMSITLGLYGSFYFFAICTFAGAIFVMLVLPETKGKSFEEIMESLR